MPTDFPYMMSNNKISPILEKIRTAAKPAKLTHELLKKLGFGSSNDRAIIPLLKKLGFLNEDGTPTEHFDRLRDATDCKYVMGERIKELYAELFAINTEIYASGDEELEGAFSRVTGKDHVAVTRYVATFKALTQVAKFDSPKVKKAEPVDPIKPEKEPEKKDPIKSQIVHPEFHYNIQLHLPATTDVSVYRAIFKSLKEILPGWSS